MKNKYQKEVMRKRDDYIISLAKKGLTFRQIKAKIEPEHGKLSTQRIHQIVSKSY